MLGAIKDDCLRIFELNKLLGSIWALSDSLYDFGKLRVIDVGHHNIRYEIQTFFNNFFGKLRGIC